MKELKKHFFFPLHFIWSLVVYKYYTEKFKHTDYFDYKKIVNIRFIEPLGFNTVCHYGCYKAVAKLTGRRFNFITDYLDHGASFRAEPETMKNLGYYNRSTIRRIYTMSEFNVSVYNECIKREKLKSKAIAVGSYIKGADFFYSTAILDEIKKKYGRILLVFPQHSHNGNMAEYNVTDFINAINKYKNEYNFDSVFVCLYWADILRGSDEKYLQNNFVVVTAGHRSDPQFLSRQKDLIYLADHTMSNHIGSYVGYSICMNKPHFMYNQQTQYFGDGIEMDKSPSLETAKKSYQEIFGTFTTTITPEQYQFTEKYWGKWQN